MGAELYGVLAELEGLLVLSLLELLMLLLYFVPFVEDFVGLHCSGFGVGFSGCVGSHIFPPCRLVWLLCRGS